MIGGAAAGSADAVAGLVEDQPREERRNEVRGVLLADPIWGTYPENLFLANLFVNPRLFTKQFSLGNLGTWRICKCFISTMKREYSVRFPVL